MGLRGPIGAGLGHRKQEGVLLTVVNDAPEVPEPPIKVRQQVRDKWDALWTSEVAKFISEKADAGALERWCTDWEEYYRLRNILKKQQFVTGSQGQAVLNPLQQVLENVIKRLEKFEDDFAARPKARVRLNLDGVQGALTAAQLNKMIEERGPRDANDDAEEDWAQGFAADA